MPATEDDPGLTPPGEPHVATTDLSQGAKRLNYLERQEYEDRHAKVKRTDKQLAFLFGLLLFAFVLLAYRTETNDTNLQNGLYNACVARVQQAVNVNQVRQIFIDRIAQGASGQTPAGQDAITQLQAFLQPLEDCGKNPR